MPAKGGAMATVTERLEEILEREAPVWGVQPVPEDHRRFGGLDLAVLWGDLSVGLLVIVAGTLLVPALGLPRALLAIALGTLLGCVPLALVGVAGAREGVPGMVLFRPLLGLRGSYLPSAFNLLQLVGWTAFEFWAMGRVANAISIDLFGLDAYPLWAAAVAAVCIALALGGPVLVVRRWLERFAVYVVLAVAAWITWQVLSAGGLGEAWARPGEGGLPFWLGVDLVVAMPVSWLPLVADYSRFARSDARAFAGIYGGYAIGNAWFYALGVLLVLLAGSGPDVLGVGASVAALAGGTVVLLTLLVGESDQAFADIYSAAVTVQNVFPRLRQRRLVVGLGALAFGVALAFGGSAQAYEFFLFLIGSVFVPLFGVFAAHYFVRSRGRYGAAAVAGARPGTVWSALVPWVLGFVLFHWCVPTGPGWWVSGVETIVGGWLGLPVPLFGGAAGASLPAFTIAFVVTLALPGASRRATTEAER
jgi:putative hydroxymethylpyrimidine transporter CytX